MTDLEILERYEDYIGIRYVNGVEETSISPCLVRAINAGIFALRAQQEAENNEPLTLEELLSMVGKPAYMVFSEKDKGQWYLITSISGEKIKFCDFDANTYYCYKNDYGPEWLAYRHPPKEAHNV